jgi:hypothetical protein
VIVDGHMQVVPAGSGVSVHAILEDSLAGREEAPEALDVNVDEISGYLPLVARIHRCGWLLPAGAAISPEDLSHG